MEEKLLLHKNNGLLVLLVTTLLYIAAIAASIGGGLVLEDGGNPALFIIGIVWAVCSFFDFSPTLRAFLLAGLLGGFTTFSSFSLETMNLLNAGKIQSALSYIVCTNVGGIIAVFGGFFLAKYSLYAIKLL